MRKRAKVALAVLSVVFLGVLVGQGLRTREPSYQGRSLSSWLETYYSKPPNMPPAVWVKRFNEERPKADEAVRQMGTNALPILLRLLQAEDSGLRFKLTQLAMKQHFFSVPYTPAENLNVAAAHAFRALGPRAKSALPALLEIMKRGNGTPVSQRAAISALGALGPQAREAVPVLLSYATNASLWVRYQAIVSLGVIRAEPDRVVPVLVNALQDPNENVQNVAVQQLGLYGRAAQSAVPALFEFMKAPTTDPVDRMNATNVLKAIDPEAAAKAGLY